MNDKKTIEQLAEEYAIQLEKNHYATETYHPASYYSGVDVGFLAGAAKQKELCDEREKLLMGMIDECAEIIESLKGWAITHSMQTYSKSAEEAGLRANLTLASIEQKLKDLK